MRRSVGLLVFVCLGLFGLTGVPVLAAEPPVKAVSPSKVPYIVRQRIAAVGVELAASQDRRLSAAAVTALSDSILKVDGAGRLLLQFHASRPVGARERADLVAQGAEVTASTADVPLARGLRWPAGLDVIQAWVPAARVEKAAELPWVAAVTTAEEGHTDAGSVDSQGVPLHRADRAQTAGIDGTGVHVGVVSDTVTHLADAVASGDLPAGVNVLATGVCGTPPCDEGTAMLEIIHDMAPGADLLFHASGGGVVAHIAALNALVTAGANVISEDIAFDTEPAFQQGMATHAAQDIAAAGVDVHSSAGNLGSTHAARVSATGTGAGPDGASSPYSGCVRDPANTVDIDPGSGTAFDVSVASGGRISITLQWSEPRAVFPSAGAGGFTDLDLYLMDAAGTTCLDRSVATQGGGAGDTMEQISYLNTTGGTLHAKIVVGRTGASGAVAAPLLDLRWRGAAALDTPTREGSLNPDSNYTADATSAAAADAGASTDPATVALEDYSAAGPVHLESTTICSGNTYPCPAGGVAGSVDFDGGGPAWTAADHVSVSGAGGFPSPFRGTSSAAPHAAGCDALVRQQLQSEGTAPTTAVVSARLRGTATPRGGGAWGAGVLVCQASARLLILLDRTGSMTATRANGHSRCRDAFELAQADVHNFFVLHPADKGAAAAVWTFADSAPSQLTSGFVDEAGAMAALATLSPEGCGGNTPLADAICAASDSLAGALPGSKPAQRMLAISSDGGENNSSGPCSGPSSTGGPPYDPGSWQQKTAAKVAGQNVALTRFWGAVTLTASDRETRRVAVFGVSDSSFFQDLAQTTGGVFQFVLDNNSGPLPPPFGFGGVVTPTIPTLDAFGLSLLGTGLLTAALVLMRRRRKLSGV
jgi:hypothetical protein